MFFSFKQIVAPGPLLLCATILLSTNVTAHDIPDNFVERAVGIVIRDRHASNIRDGVDRLLSLDRRPVHARPNGADRVARMLAEVKKKD